MVVAVVCPACKAKLKAPDNLLGKRVKCPGCARPILVKADAVTASARTPTPASKKSAKPQAPPVDEPLDEGQEQEVPRPKKRRKAEDEGGAAPPAPEGPSSDKERGTAMWIHLLPPCLVCCGGVGPLISLFLWISKRKESPFIDHHGKTWLNFAINLFAVVVALFILSFILGIVAGLLGSMVAMIVNGLFGLIYFALFIYVVVLHVLIGLKAKRGEWAEYKVLFKVMK